MTWMTPQPKSRERETSVPKAIMTSPPSPSQIVDSRETILKATSLNFSEKKILLKIHFRKYSFSSGYHFYRKTDKSLIRKPIKFSNTLETNCLEFILVGSNHILQDLNDGCIHPAGKLLFLLYFELSPVVAF